MDFSSPSPSPSPNESDKPTSARSPSRLNFCMEDLEDDSPIHRMDWSRTAFSDDSPYTFTNDALVVDIAPRDPQCLLIVDDPPQTADSHAHENTDPPPPFFAPPDSMDAIVTKLQSPTPVRPPSIQIQAETQELMPHSRIASHRLNYPHHGFSRSALLQQKILWNSRHEEWAEWQSRMECCMPQKQESETNDAYTGLAPAQPRVIVSPPPYMRTPPSGLERDFANHPPRRREQDVHASIYPRVGDISALRDPYSVNVDRSFFRLPLWTLHKTLYSLDMQQGSASLPPSSTPVYNAAHVQASVSASTLSSYSSSTSGDDEESDSTLVADDSPVSKSQRPLEPWKSTQSPQSPASWKHFCGWELSWYARWELLIGIFQGDHTKYDAIDGPMKIEVSERKARPPSPPGRIFRFTVGDDDEEEDEDYGTLVANSTFSVDFDEECERALAFYNRELRCSEMMTH